MSVHLTRQQNRPSWRRVLLGYIGLYTVVSIRVAPAVVFLLATRRVRVHGFRRALRALWRGNLILAVRHISALEIFVIPMLLWPLLLLRPRCFPWSLAKHDAFPESKRWLYPLFRCILFNRNERTTAPENRQAQAIMGEVLAAHGVLLVYAEGTRGYNIAPERLLRRGERSVGRIAFSPLRLAAEKHSHILPVYVEFGDVREELSLRACIRRTKHTPLVISFGAVQEPPCAYRSTDNRDLQEQILSA